MAVLGEADPEALLEWLSTGHEDQRDMQSMALEHLCMALLMADNVDRCFELYPPKTFIPPLCMVFLDDSAPDGILEATARALTYYLDVSAECTRRIISTEGTVRAICNRLLIASLDNQTGKDLAEQCIKVLEHMSSRDLSALLEAGALNAVLAFIRSYGSVVHKDALRSAMSVVSRLCSKIEPADTNMSSIIESLTALLRHKDAQVSDSALRCFTALADRFTRRNADTSALTCFGLGEILLHRLINTPKNSRGLTGTPGSAVDVGNTSSVPSVLSLLQVLTRFSPTVSQDISHSADFLRAVEAGLEGDDRCIMEMIRWLDILVTILFEGRHSLPKQAPSSFARYALRRFEGASSSDRSNRHLIESIRGKDYEALVDAVENGSVDVNTMDDVGQSLLNWASAFGTQEMVEFLCENGANPNAGNRSSSLHYAACFGRPGIAKVLLQHGADASLKDEDGKTSLEKAKERNEDGHKEVVKLLGAPEQWGTPEKRRSEKEKPTTAEDKSKKGEDPAMGTKLIVMLLPLLAHTAVTSLTSLIRRSCANVIKKMLNFIPGETLTAISGSDHSFQDGVNMYMVKLVSMLLGNDEDDECFLLALMIIDLLITKSRELFFDSFYRAGVVGQIAAAAAKSKSESLATAFSFDASSVYKFGEWTVWGSPEFALIWTESVVIRLSSSSQGLLHAYFDEKLVPVSSDGVSGGASPTRLDQSEDDADSPFVDRLSEIVWGLKKSEKLNISLLPSTEHVRFGNWILVVIENRMLRVTNAINETEINLRNNQAESFVFSGPNDPTTTVTAHAKVCRRDGKDLNLTFVGEGKGRSESIRTKLEKLAQEVHSKHFLDAQPAPRGPMGKLITVISQFDAALQKQGQQSIRRLHDDKKWSDDFRTAVRDLIHALGDGNSLSPYEIQSTGLVRMLSCVLGNDAAAFEHMRTQRVELWKAVFHQAESASRSGRSPAETLVRILVSVLECTEKFPVSAVDSSSVGTGFQALTRPVSVRLEIKGSSNQLVDRTGRKLRVEPLVTVRELETFLWKKLFKNWYDYDRSELSFVKQIEDRAPNAQLQFSHTFDFDENGIIYWIGTNAKTVKDWINPATTGLVAVFSSDGRSLPCGNVSDFLNHSALPAYVRTSETKEAWLAVDLGIWVEPTCYSLRHGRGSGALRSWLLQASRDGCIWVTLKSHVRDPTLSTAGATNTWRLDDLVDSRSWRYFRVQMSGENAEHENCLSLSGFEIYGTITGVCDDVGKGFKERPIRRLRQDAHHSSDNFFESRSRVKRGRDWSWGNQDGEPPGMGTIVARHADEWVDVIWDNGEGHTYRMGAEGKFDLQMVSARELTGMASLLPQFARSVSSPSPGLTGYAVAISRANRSVPAAELSGSGRSTRSLHNRPSASTLSLPETTTNFDSAVAVTEHGLSTDQLYRTAEVQLTGIARAEPVSQLNAFGGSGTGWRLAFSGIRHSPESGPSASDSPRSVEPSEDTLPELTDLRPFSQAVDRRRSTRASTRFDPRAENTSEQSTPVGSLLSLNDPTDYQLNALNQLSFSVPNLTGPVMDETRQRVVRLTSRGSRTACPSSSETARSHLQALLSGSSENDSSGPLSGAQSFPTLSQQQERSMDSLRMATTKTRALLRSMRSTSSDSGEFFRALRGSVGAGLDLQEALAMTSHDEDTDGREGEEEGFISLAEFAMRTLQGRPEREEDMMETESSEEEVLEHTRQRTGWCDEFVLKRQFASLIPNFDPRPGRNNVSQTTDLELSLPARGDLGTIFDSRTSDDSKMILSFRVPSATTSNCNIQADNLEETVVSLLQRAVTAAEGFTKGARGRKLWEGSFTLSYGERTGIKSSITDLSQKDSSVVLPSCCPTDPNFVLDTLNVLRALQEISVPPKKDSDLCHIDPPPLNFSVDPHAFLSQKITGKMMAQLSDVVALASDSFPSWCDTVMTQYPVLFPFETRRLYFTATAFGTERAIVWLQSQREQSMEGNRPTRSDGLFHEFRIGRQKHVRVKVARQHILDWAMAVIFSQGPAKTVLEVEFESEEGTGLGPTLEFYALVAAELQRKDLGMWICDDDHLDITSENMDLGAGAKPPGYYVRSTAGLFPAAYPPEHPALPNLKNLFRFLGIIVGKALMDNRLMDIPVSTAFLKLLCSRGAKRNSPCPSSTSLPASRTQIESREYPLPYESSGRRNKRQQRRMKKSGLRAMHRPVVPTWHEGILGVEQLEEVDPHRGRFIRSLLHLMRRKQLIEEDDMLGEEHKREKLKTLACELHTGNDKVEHVRLEDLGLTFEFSPSSRVFKYISCDLIIDGDTVPVNVDNMEMYTELTMDFCFSSGIRVQMEAFREGLEQVIPLEKLHSFSPEELRLMLCGDQAPNWTREDILAYTEPKLGYTHDSPAFQRFVNVLAGLNGEERKAFVQFVTGCSSLPPGGLASLHPKLTIVRKVTRSEDEGYPSVNTCVHYLKLPEYSSEEILYQRLIAATKERGFHFN